MFSDGGHADLGGKLNVVEFRLKRALYNCTDLDRDALEDADREPLRSLNADPDAPRLA